MLPRKFFSKVFSTNQSGQIVIVFLLVLVVGLAIVLSIASRTITDIRQTTTSDESNQAYFAAEAGIESILKKISEDPSYTSASGETINFAQVNNSKADVVTETLRASSGEVFEVPGKVAKDEVIQIYLMSAFNNINTAGASGSVLNSHTLNIYWDENTGVSPVPALEVSVLQCTGACTASGDFSLAKMTFDPDSARASTNGFCNSGVTSGATRTTNLGNSYPYRNLVRLTLNNRGTCANNDQVTGKPVLARLRLLYNTSEAVRLGVESTPILLPVQGQKITSTGTTPSGVTRKLTVTKLYPALPALFDYSLFNGNTSTPLTKP